MRAALIDGFWIDFLLLHDLQHHGTVIQHDRSLELTDLRRHRGVDERGRVAAEAGDKTLPRHGRFRRGLPCLFRDFVDVRGRECLRELLLRNLTRFRVARVGLDFRADLAQLRDAGRTNGIQVRDRGTALRADDFADVTLLCRESPRRDRGIVRGCEKFVGLGHGGVA